MVSKYHADTGMRSKIYFPLLKKMLHLPEIVLTSTSKASQTVITTVKISRLQGKQVRGIQIFYCLVDRVIMVQRLLLGNYSMA